jgi:hypothetical protein
MSVNIEPSVPSIRNALFVIPRGQGDGFQARVRGHVLDLIDPSSYELSPSADDLFILSMASALAWSARTFLRARGVPDYVSISAEWRTSQDPAGLADITLTVTVSRSVEPVTSELATVLENSIAARSLAKPVVHISFEGVNR